MAAVIVAPTSVCDTVSDYCNEVYELFALHALLSSKV